ncbi:MAG: shikimate kinase [Bacillota bacterium]|nr:shikimate kinase [Bacillota bacterium]
MVVLKKKNVVLTGFMGTGKTAIGKRLASHLKYNFIDTDREIEEVTGLRIPEIFRKYGEKRFRAEEYLVVQKVAERTGCVIATGGGVVLNPENVKRLRRNGLIILLEAEPGVIARRLQRHHVRPLLVKGDNLVAQIEALLKVRAPFYENHDFKVNTSDLSFEQVIENIICFLKKQGWEFKEETKHGNPSG